MDSRVQVTLLNAHTNESMETLVSTEDAVRAHTGDLLKKWKVGPVVAQACHGVTAALVQYYNDPYVQEYLNDLANMHKVVLETSDLSSLEQLASTLKENNIDHTMWIEQPENECTCLVIKPYPKSEIEIYVKDLKLCSKKIK